MQEALQKTDLSALAEGILEQGKKIAEDSSVLNLLTTEYGETTRAIDNLLRAVEQGIFTQSTKERLEQLETNRDPDGNDSHREFSFYEVKMTVEVDRHTFGGEKEKQTYAIVLWI